MLIRTWGFVATKPQRPWVAVEIRAERGALMRTSGLPAGAAQESMARLRAALAHVGLRHSTHALTLHVHPTCTKDDVPHLDLAFAAALLKIGGRLQAQDLQHTAHAGALTLSGDIQDPTLGPATVLSMCRASVPPEVQRIVHAPGGDALLPENHSLQQGWEISNLLALVNSKPSWRNLHAAPFPKLGRVSANHPKLHWEEIQGEGHAKSWLAIAAKHRLPVLMSGPPGRGKTSLAKTCSALRAQSLHTSDVPWVAPHPAGGVAGLVGLGDRGRHSLALGRKPMEACSSWTSFPSGPGQPVSRCVMSWRPTAWNCIGQKALLFGHPSHGLWPPPTPALADEATNNACARRQKENCTEKNARRRCSSASPFNSKSGTIRRLAPNRGTRFSLG